MDALIKGPLAYSHNAIAKHEAVGEVNAADTLEKVKENLSGTIQESQAELLYDGLPVLPMREVQLQQLFQNLVGNAIKYRKNSEHPRIVIKAAREGSHWKFSVQD